MIKFILTFLLIFVSTLSMSQFCVGFHGIVTEYFSGDPIKGVQLTSTNSKGDVDHLPLEVDSMHLNWIVVKCIT